MVFNNIKFDSCNHAKFSSLLNRFGFDYEYKKTMFRTTLGEISSHFIVKRTVRSGNDEFEYVFIVDKVDDYIDMKCEQISNQTGKFCWILTGEDFKNFEIMQIQPTVTGGFMNCRHINPQHVFVDTKVMTKFLRSFNASDEYWAVYTLLRGLSVCDLRVIVPSYHDFIGSVL